MSALRDEEMQLFLDMCLSYHGDTWKYDSQQIASFKFIRRGFVKYVAITSEPVSLWPFQYTHFRMFWDA